MSCLPRVVLLGDSIRMGYEPFVRSELASEAYVWGPSENGQHSVNLLLQFWPWIAAQQPDILHLNAGIWDTRHVARNDARQLVPLDRYRENIRQLIELTRKHTKARIVWATTTPLKNHPANQSAWERSFAGREASDIAVYNEAAARIADEEGVLLNDLYRRVEEKGTDDVLSDDGVHFSKHGYRYLGAQVAQFLRENCFLNKV